VAANFLLAISTFAAIAPAFSILVDNLLNVSGFIPLATPANVFLSSKYL